LDFHFAKENISLFGFYGQHLFFLILRLIKQKHKSYSTSSFWE